MATKKVLVVDDQADMRILIRSILETDRSDNFQVVEAKTSLQRGGPSGKGAAV
jgi:CheY-like chemotaxis protein